MYAELVKYQSAPFNNALKSNFMVYGFKSNGGDDNKIKDHLSNVQKVCETISIAAIENAIDLDQDSLRVKLKDSASAQYEYYTLDPHISIGYSPFMFYEKDGIKGVFIKMKHRKSVFCNKTIEKLSREMYESSLLNDAPMSKKACKKIVLEEIERGNITSVPLIESESSIHLYIDLEKDVLLTKSTKRDSESINVFYQLIKKAMQFINDSEIVNAESLIQDTFSERFDKVCFAQQAISNNIAFGPYHVGQLVSFYAKRESDKNDSVSSVEPTMTADFISKDDASQLVKMKNSVGIVATEDGTMRASFSMIDDFSNEKNMDVVSVRVQGEVPRADYLAKYCEEFPEQAPSSIQGEHIEMSYDTRAKDGNIMFKIVDGISEHTDITYQLLINELADTHYSIPNMEPLLLKNFAKNLSVLHDSIQLFTDLYLNANKAKPEFSNEFEESFSQ